MISLDRASYQVQPRYAEYAGLRTDVKPVEVDNGDEFQEIDTGFVYKFDKTNNEWVKQPTGSGGGGGTNDYNDLINLPQINGVELIGNKTSAELGILKNPITLANIIVSGQGIKTITESIQNIDDLYTVSVIITPTEDFNPNNCFVGFSTPTGECQIALINAITLNANTEFVISAERFTDFTVSTGFLNASYMWLNKTAYYVYEKKVWSGATEFYMREHSSGGFPEGTRIKVVGK